MKNIIGLFFLLVASYTFAQPEVAEVEWKDGKKYYIHFVQTGNTLYGLTKLYNVTADQIAETNPEVLNGLKEGQKILIPATKEEKGSTKTGENQKTHLVEKSETLYGISRKYNVTMEQMVQANPGIEAGINVGQTLVIPAPNEAAKALKPVLSQQKEITFHDTVVVHTVLEFETMYSISKRFMVSVEDLQQFNGMKNQKIRKGDVLKIPLKKEKYTQVEVREIKKEPIRKVDEELIFKSKNEYLVLMVLPFNLDKAKDGLSNIALEFYMGAEIALDSLQKLGLTARIEVIDGSVDTTKLKSILNKKEFYKADLVIGPFLGNSIEFMSAWCKVNQIRMISPVIAQTDILKGNPYVYNAVTSDITLIKSAAKYIVKKHDKDQVILVKVGAKDEELYQAFRQQFMKLTNEGSKQKLIEVNIADLGTYIRKGVNTTFVVPSRDKATSMKFMTEMNKVASKAGAGSITVFGTKEWGNFDDIKSYMKNKYSLHFASANDFNYSYPETKNLTSLYRSKYNADLSKYSTQGFDVTFYFINKMLMGQDPKDGVMNSIRLQNLKDGNGQENKASFILKQEDYEIIKMDLINE
ncbi:MAG: LysM peptidoglycan-binding domain-containing protein [Crocinitomicaceae bacterium]|nr:LysM peptidoglycan-binding domain-containing protein [Crocinitomicaceae bacterium]